MSVNPSDELNEVYMSMDEFDRAATEVIQMVRPETPPEGIQLGAMIIQFPTQHQVEDFQNLLAPANRVNQGRPRHKRQLPQPTWAMVWASSTVATFVTASAGWFW